MRRFKAIVYLMRREKSEGIKHRTIGTLHRRKKEQGDYSQKAEPYNQLTLKGCLCLFNSKSDGLVRII
jgi:hypothetical protein